MMMVVMIVIVSTAAIVIMVMMIVVMMIVIAVIMMVVIAVIMIVVTMVVIMIVIFMIFKQALNLSTLCQCMTDCLFAKLIPWCRDDRCFCIFFTKCVYAFFYFFICHHLCTAYYDC